MNCREYRIEIESTPVGCEEIEIRVKVEARAFTSPAAANCKF